MPVWQHKKPLFCCPMIKITFIFVLMLASLAGMSQTDTVGVDLSSDAVFIKVETESSYPGGLRAWQMYLNKNLRFPEEAIKKVRGRKPKQWEVMIQFIVTKEGKVTDVQALTKFGNGLEEEAIRIIKKSGDWIPAKQNGRPVHSYKRQPVIFRVEIG